MNFLKIFIGSGLRFKTEPGNNCLVKILLFCFLCAGNYKAGSQTVYNDFAQLEKRFAEGKDTLFLINFWATWCKPCVEELPIFNELNISTPGNEKTKVLLVSLDFKNDIEKKLLPFISEKKIRKEVVLLTDPDMNSWIPRVNKDWDGNIPVTWFFQSGKKSLLINRAVKNEAELQQLIAGFIGNKNYSLTP